MVQTIFCVTEVTSTKRLSIMLALLLLLCGCGTGDLWFYGDIVSCDDQELVIAVPKSDRKRLGEELSFSAQELAEWGVDISSWEGVSAACVSYKWGNNGATLVAVEQGETFRGTVTEVNNNYATIQVTSDSGGLLNEAATISGVKRLKVGDAVSGYYTRSDPRTLLWTRDK